MFPVWFYHDSNMFPAWFHHDSIMFPVWFQIIWMSMIPCFHDSKLKTEVKYLLISSISHSYHVSSMIPAGFHHVSSMILDHLNVYNSMFPWFHTQNRHKIHLLISSSRYSYHVSTMFPSCFQIIWMSMIPWFQIIWMSMIPCFHDSNVKSEVKYLHISSISYWYHASTMFPSCFHHDSRSFDCLWFHVSMIPMSKQR